MTKAANDLDRLRIRLPPRGFGVTTAHGHFFGGNKGYFGIKFEEQGIILPLTGTLTKKIGII